MKNSPSIDPKNITCLTRLDHNRFVHQVSKKINVPNKRIKNLVIWGNHSSTQYPDIELAFVEDPSKSSKIPLTDLINDENWVQKELIKKIQNRVLLPLIVGWRNP